MKLRPCGLVLTVLAIGFVTCSSAWAEMWNFTGGGGSGGGAPNTYTFNSAPASVTVTATAWYVNGGNLLQRATVGQYSAGLGICTTSESCFSPQHQVDNTGQLEFMLLQFNQPLQNISFTIDPSPDSNGGYIGGIPDRDVSFWAGSPSLGGSLLTGINFSTMGTLFTAGTGDITNSDSGAAITVNLTTSGPVSAVLFGALDTLNSDDFFKIAGMAGTKPPNGQVPEPTSVVLFGTVLAGVVHLLRKKRLHDLNSGTVTRPDHT